MKISVIIPVYNIEQYIARCLDSILNQNFNDFEVIIVNDASTDASLEIIRKYTELDERCILLNNEVNSGLMYTRYVGYRHAKGDYFVFCDGDDYLLPNALCTLYNSILTSNADIVASAFIRKTYAKEIAIYNKLSYGNDSIAVYKSLMLEEFKHSLWAKIFSRKLFDNFSYETKLNQTNGEDALLFYQVLSHVSRVEVIDELTYCYVYNSKSATALIDRNKIKQILYLQYWRFNLLKSKIELKDSLLNYTISKRIELLKFESISKGELFPEEELQEYLSISGLLRVFPILRSIKLYLLLYCSFWGTLVRAKYLLPNYFLNLKNGK